MHGHGKASKTHAGLPHALHMVEFMQHTADLLLADHTIQVTLHIYVILAYSKLLSPDKRYTCVYETSQPAARKTKQFSGNLGKNLLKRCHLGRVRRTMR